MATLSDDDVRHIAKLARLNLSDEEVKRLGPQLVQILEFVDQLQEVDTSNVEADPQVVGLENCLREDVINASEVPAADILACSPLPIIDNQIETPSALG